MSLVQTEVQKPSSYTVAGTEYTFPLTKTGVDVGTAAVEVGIAPGAGKYIFVMGVIFINPTAAAITMVLQQGGTDLFPDIQVPANNNVFLPFPQALRLTVNEGVDVKANSVDTGIGVIIFGKVDVKG